jgi:hypothetical protein
MSLLWGLLAGSAHAFCGHYVGGVSDELYSRASEIAIVHQDGRTTMTFKNEYEGNAAAFGLLVPVPVVLSEENVAVVDGALIDRLRLYTEPRQVEYFCDDYTWWSSSSSGGGSGYSVDYSYPGTSTVEVLDQFLVGNYEIVILSAEQSTGLLAWLDENGYATSPDSRTLLQDYIDRGSYFMAAKVALDAPTAGFLEPLQVNYEYPGFGLPIRLGTLNSGGCDQDLIVYLLTELEDGLVSISNVPEVTLPDDCLWSDTDFTSFDAFYEYQMATVMDAQPGPAYVTEYGWSSGGCDPCPSTPLDDSDVQELGFVGSSSGVYTTRLHLRYDPDQVFTDLVFDETHTTPSIQQRYIVREPHLENQYPVCLRGWVQDPVDCDGNPVAPGGPGPYTTDPLPPPPPPETNCPLPEFDPPSGEGETTDSTQTADPLDAPEDPSADEPEAEVAKEGCGCQGAPLGGAASLVLAAVLLARRRYSHAVT